MSQNIIWNERKAWDIMRGPHNANVRRKYWKEFREMFPGGYNDDLRQLANRLRTKRGRERIFQHEEVKDFKRIHPLAFRLLEKFGTIYRPKLWNRPPSFGEPVLKSCSLNSSRLMLSHNSVEGINSPLVYVEGITLGVLLPPILHAWNAKGLNSEEAIDWTFYTASRWNVYLGIALTEEEYMTLQQILRPRKPVSILLLHKKSFPKIENELVKILNSRN